jgi:hypothetical protein
MKICVPHKECGAESFVIIEDKMKYECDIIIFLLSELVNKGILAEFRTNLAIETYYFSADYVCIIFASYDYKIYYPYQVSNCWLANKFLNLVRRCVAIMFS